MERKSMTIVASLFSILLMSFMFASAYVYPMPFVDDNEANVAIIYGSTAAATDSTAADNIVKALADGIITPEELERILSSGVSEDEVPLGANLGGSGNIKTTLTDNKISSLFDGKVDWDDGENSDSYDIHEEILIGDLDVMTTLDNNDFDGVALTNNKGLEYRIVFEEDIFNSDRELNNDGAETLDLNILGKEYSIEDVDTNSITVTTAESIILAAGESKTIEGVTLTVGDIYSDSVVINGIYIKEDSKKTVDGIKVKVDGVYYKDSDTQASKVRLSAGGDISKEYSDGDAFIGEDEDDPEWVWSIDNPGEKDGYVGVKYALRQVDEDDDVVYEGDQYTFPNGFVTVKFDGLTDVEYHDYEVYFDNLDMYEKGSSNTNGAPIYDVDVVVIGGDEEDSFVIGGDIETDTLYLQKIDSTTAKVYYMDIDEDFSTGKPVYSSTVNLINSTAVSIATLVAGDTNKDVGIVGGENISLSIGDIRISLGGVDDFLYLGNVAEDSEEKDVIASDVSIGNKDNDVMDHYGVIIEGPENNADNDKVIISVPSERVYAQVSVLGSEEDLDSDVVIGPTADELNITKVIDSQVATASGKNIIVVGGSCINTVAAELLGGKFCGEEFTAKTGVGAGQVLIQTFDRGDGNVATLVAGYEAADTTRGVSYLLSNNINVIAGDKVII